MDIFLKNNILTGIQRDVLLGKGPCQVRLNTWPFISRNKIKKFRPAWDKEDTLTQNKWKVSLLTSCFLISPCVLGILQTRCKHTQRKDCLKGKSDAISECTNLKWMILTLPIKENHIYKDQPLTWKNCI